MSAAEQAPETLGGPPTPASDDGPARRASSHAESSDIPNPPESHAREQDGTDQPDRPSREAAKYRRQLREVEAERDRLRSTVEALQRAEVQRLAAADLAQPAALWAAGTQLADLLDADGLVDPGKVAEAVAAARSALGLAAPIGSPAPDPGQGIIQQPDPATGWSAVLRG